MPPHNYQQVENAYYAAKGAKATDPGGALAGFQQVDGRVCVYVRALFALQ